MTRHLMLMKSQKKVAGLLHAKMLWIPVLLFLIPAMKTFPQATLCESLEFETGSSVMTTETKDKLDKLCNMGLDARRVRVGLTLWQDNETAPTIKATLAECRMRTVFAYLIAKNFGNLVSEIRIKPLQTVSLNRAGTTQPINQIEICILEKFPDDNDDEILKEAIPEKILEKFPGSFVKKPDTIIRGPHGTLIRFTGGSFEPFRFSDFQFQLDEMFTTEAIGNHNMSTMTTTGALVASFKAVRISVAPVNPEIPLPATLKVKATLLIPVDSAMENPTGENMVVMLPGKGSKPFITWNKTVDKPRMEMYGGRKYFVVQTDVMGYIAIGRLNSLRTAFFVKIPRFSELKITLKSDSDNSIALFNNPDQSKIRLMPGEIHPAILKEFFISAEAIDRSGNLYVLKKTVLDKFVSKKNKNCITIRKKDFVKL